MEYANDQEGFFIGLIEDGEPLEGFDGIESSEFVAFFPAQCLTKEDFFGGRVREAPDHSLKNTLKSEQEKPGVRFFVYFRRSKRESGIWPGLSVRWITDELTIHNTNNSPKGTLVRFMGTRWKGANLLDTQQSGFGCHRERDSAWPQKGGAGRVSKRYPILIPNFRISAHLEGIPCS